MSKRKKRKEPLQNVLIDAYAAEGKSVAHLENGKVLFVEGVVPGDVVDVFVFKDKTSWAQGKLLKLVEPSKDRITPFCPHFGVCGGCKWQMLPYEKQLAYKQQQVADQLRRIGNVALPEIEPILGSERTEYYRNKLEFTFSTKRYKTNLEIADRTEKFEDDPVVGFHAPGLFDKVVEINQCFLQPEPSNLLLNTIRNHTQKHNLPYYDFKAQSGWLRNVIIRVATTGQVLVNLVIQHEREAEREALLQQIWNTVPGITSLNYTINSKVNDTIYDQEVVCWKGSRYIEERLGALKFKISPKSFFQTNTKQAEALYSVVRDFAGFTGTEVLYDLYCGTGSIGIFCADAVKKVIGIETVVDAIADAKENAALNNIDNTSFFAGDVAEICNDAFFDTHGFPDVIITDPPRIGMHPKLVAQLLRIRSKKIVYVSCNPATQARDLALLNEAYHIVRTCPVDMFPHTHHIENVVLLEMREDAIEV